MKENFTETMLFAILFLSFNWYLFLGVYIYKIDKKSKTNIIFLILCIFTGLWAIGYAFMLISPNIEIANIWRFVSSFGWCFFDGIWISFALSLENSNKKGVSLKLRSLIYAPSLIFLISNFLYLYEPSKVLIKGNYGFVDIYTTTTIGTFYTIYFPIFFILGFILILLRGRSSEKNRVKMQTRIILITSLISFALGATTDLILPSMGISIFPLAIISMLIAMLGMFYAISKHRMMSITPEFVSEYIFKVVNEPIFILGEDFLIKNCNDASLELIGYNYMYLVGENFNQLINSRDFNVDTVLKEGYVNNVEVDVQRESKVCIVCELSGTIIYDEYKDILGIVILLHDISERKTIEEMQKKYNIELENKIIERTSKLEQSNHILNNEIRDRILAEKQILYAAYNDALTGLANRKKLMEIFSTLIEYKNEKFAVLFIDLDGFKNINDEFGHQAGDVILKEVAGRLNGVIRSSGTISRIGGDEFIIILRDLKSSANAEKIAIIIGTALKSDFTYKGNNILVGVSIGISIFPEHGTDVDTLIKNADLAMYEVKNNGGYGYSIYSKSMNNKIINKSSMKVKLNNALSNNEFITYYQPIIDLKSMKVLNSEALIRWKQGDRIIPPIKFIPIAKSMGEVVAIDNWMLANACDQCKKWQNLGAKEFSISVNTSYKQLKQLNFIELVVKILNANSLSPRYLNLEITEDEAMEDPELIINILTELKALGIKISLDDFGTGYSSLSYVNMLPIDTIKIDKSLISNLKNGTKNLLIIKSIIEMAHSLNIKVITEGIETEEQFNIIKELKCDLIQGYLIAKPLPAYDFQHEFIK